MPQAPPLKVLLLSAEGAGSGALMQSAVRELVNAGHEVLASPRGSRPAVLDDAYVATLRLDRDRSAAELALAVEAAVRRYAPDLVVASSG